MNRIEKYIVPWDFSDHSKMTLRYVLQNFRGQAIKVICVLEPPNPYEPSYCWGDEAEEKAVQQCRQDFLEQAGLADEFSVQFEVVFGDPAQEICRFADRVGADQIVLSTHGRTGLQKLIMGSVAQKVISQSSHPVILLPARWFEKHKMGDSYKLSASGAGQ